MNSIRFVYIYIYIYNTISNLFLSANCPWQGPIGYGILLIMNVDGKILAAEREGWDEKLIETDDEVEAKLVDADDNEQSGYDLFLEKDTQFCLEQAPEQ